MGPAIEGIRMAPEVSVEECFRLARSMTLKTPWPVRKACIRSFEHRGLSRHPEGLGGHLGGQGGQAQKGGTRELLIFLRF